MAPHSSTLAWRIPWMEEPGRLQSMGSLKVGHDWATSLSFSLSCIGEGNDNPLQCSCLENPRDGGTWWAAVYGVAQSQTRLTRLSSSSSSTSVSGETGVMLSTSWVPYITQDYKHFAQTQVLSLGEQRWKEKRIALKAYHTRCVVICSAMSDSLRLHGQKSVRLLCPWDSPGKSAAAGCHALLQGVFQTQGWNPHH